MEQKLRKLLKRVPRHYDDFELAMVLIGRESPQTMELLINYLEEHPQATITDVGRYAEGISTSVSEPPEPDDD